MTTTNVTSRIREGVDSFSEALDELSLGELLERLGERGRELAARVEPSAAERRGRRLRTAGWFAGGFVAGIASGWILHARMSQAPQEPEHLHHGMAADTDGRGESPYGREAEAIDARRENAPFG